MTAKTLYAYTLQPVPYEVSEAEQRQAQLMIWRSTNKFSKKAWMIMIALVVLSSHMGVTRTILYNNK